MTIRRMTPVTVNEHVSGIKFLAQEADKRTVSELLSKIANVRVSTLGKDAEALREVKAALVNRLYDLS